jgi:asparagine synthetase B (glutamine-hydrolysing)
MPSSGALFVIATAPGRSGLEEARAAARRLKGTVAGSWSEDRELPGAVWGFTSAGVGPGNRISHAVAGSREALLLGDPAWREPRSLRPCDADELLRAWEGEGPRAARLLDNLFAAVVADRASGEVTIITDITGGIRLYAASLGGLRVFTTSYLGLSRLVPAKAIDGDSIACFFHLGYFPGRRTALRDVEVHPFASLTRVKDGTVAVEPYWTPRMDGGRSRPRAEVLDGAVREFNGTVREHCAGFGDMLLAMTAGLDSRTVASSLIKQRIPFATYTHGFPGCWEAKRVRRIVARHGIPHRFVPLEESFSSRLCELTLRSFEATEGEISAIEKCHLIHVLSLLRESAGDRTGLLLGGGAGMLKGTYYRLLEDEDPFTPAGVDRYVAWNLSRRLPAIFARDVPAGDPRILRDFVTASLEEVEGGSFFQKLDYFYLVRYRRWAGGVKGIYRRFFPVREPFVSARLLEYLFPVDPAIKKAKLPHFEILERNLPAIRYDLTNKMTPALPLNARTLIRFLPSVAWRAKQVLRGFSRRYLPFELFRLADFVDYGKWIQGASGRALVEDLLAPKRMRSAALYDDAALQRWLARDGLGGPSFPLVDRMCTLELYFRAIGA